MKRILILSLLMAALSLLSGCGSIYTVQRGVPVSFQAPKTSPSQVSGKADVFVGKLSGSGAEKYEFGLGTNGLFLLEQTSDGFYHLKGITQEFDEGYYYKNCVGNCRAFLAKKHGLTFYPASTGMTIAENDSQRILFKSSLNRSNSFVSVEYIDDTQHMMVWKQQYANLRNGTPDQYMTYISEFPDKPQAQQARRDFFSKFFKVGIVNKQETAPRAITSRELLSSMAGSCKDISRTIKVEPTASLNLRNDFNITVKYTLRRTYKPLKLAEDNDPIHISRSYTLRASDNYRLLDTVKFDCVMTSGRFHAAGLSLLGKLMGAKPEDAAVVTTLSDIGFDLDVVDIK
jgi:hypothetical protein